MNRKKLEKVKAEVIAICEKESAIVAAFLFGSHAKDRAREKSDLDIAILLVEGAGFSLPGFISTLENRIGCRVDVVVLNRAGELIKYEVRRHGLLLFERSSSQRKNFEVKSRKLFEDFLFLHHRYAKKVLYGDVMDHGESTRS
jgi:predicted nucleotidyltransferase